MFFGMALTLSLLAIITHLPGKLQGRYAHSRFPPLHFESEDIQTQQWIKIWTVALCGQARIQDFGHGGGSQRRVDPKGGPEPKICSK